MDFNRAVKGHKQPPLSGSRCWTVFDAKQLNQLSSECATADLPNNAFPSTAASLEPDPSQINAQTAHNALGPGALCGCSASCAPGAAKALSEGQNMTSDRTLKDSAAQCHGVVVVRPLTGQYNCSSSNGTCTNIYPTVFCIKTMTHILTLGCRMFQAIHLLVNCSPWHFSFKFKRTEGYNALFLNNSIKGGS